jgi:hypothetical protein
LRPYSREELELLGWKITHQDNRATSYPLYCVMEKHRILTEDGPHFVWLDEDWEEFDEKTCERFERIYDWRRDHPILKDKYRQGYTLEDRFVTACFTEDGAKAYLAANGHNLKKPHIYVASMYRNVEMIRLRETLRDHAARAYREQDRRPWEYR